MQNKDFRKLLRRKLKNGKVAYFDNGTHSRYFMYHAPPRGDHDAAGGTVPCIRMGELDDGGDVAEVFPRRSSSGGEFDKYVDRYTIRFMDRDDVPFEIADLPE